jgi:hypothetical protein
VFNGKAVEILEWNFAKKLKIYDPLGFSARYGRRVQLRLLAKTERAFPLAIEFQREALLLAEPHSARSPHPSLAEGGSAGYEANAMRPSQARVSRIFDPHLLRPLVYFRDRYDLAFLSTAAYKKSA